jgi:L-fucose mutarotase
MLTFSLTHPELIGALAAAGHGSKVLLADGNYPHSTAVGPNAQRVFLNLRPGLVSVPDVLTTILTAIEVEAAAVMAAPDGAPVAAHQEYAAAMPHLTGLDTLERFAFYQAAKADDVALLVATADQRMCANLLLTIGVRL